MDGFVAILNIKINDLVKEVFILKKNDKSCNIVY